MSTWKGAWFLTKHELRMIRWKHLLTLFFIGYILLMTTPLYSYMGEEERYMLWTADFINLSLLPILGFMSTQAWGFYWKTDVYTRKLATWRTMPITLRQIVVGKAMLFVINAVPAIIIFYICQFFMLKQMGMDLNVLDFSLQAVFWIGYALVIGSLYVYGEYGFSGKVYFLICMAIVFIFLIGALVYSAITRDSMIGKVMNSIATGHWWLPMLSLLVAAAALSISVLLTEKRLMKREFLN